MKKHQAGEHSLSRKNSETILKVDGVGKESEGESWTNKAGEVLAGTHRPCEEGCELD